MIERRLEVIEGSEKGTAIPLAATPVTIGRAPGNVVVVKDAAISRQHARIFERDGRHFVADLNSSHGTFVNGTKVTLQELHEGDELKLGATLFRYGGPRREAEPPIAAPVKESAPASSLPPVNTTYRRALDEAGEDPFALEEPAPPAAAPVAPEPTRAPVATPSFAAAPPPVAPPPVAPGPVAPPKSFDVAPQIELRGRTAEHFATRGAAPPTAAAAAAAGVHVPPPLSSSGRRRRGPFTFLSDELDQRGRFARLVATLFALAVAGGLLWLTLQLTGSVAKVRPPSEEDAPTGPERPSLPPRH